MIVINWQERTEAAEKELAEMQAILAKLREQKPFGRYVKIIDPMDKNKHTYGVDYYSGFYVADLLDKEVYAAPVPAPVVPATCNDGLQVELREILQWMIGQRGKAGHDHRVAGIWDGDNGEKAGKPCEICAMYDKARALLQSAEVRHD